MAAGEHVLLEGAQGTLLDLDHGTYPYVTSSNPIAGGACTGGGVGPRQIDEVLGVLKAYSTRVGSGPLPTELDDEVGTHLVEVGREFGTTTGRRRRCGWLDFMPLRYAVQINSVSSIMLNKLDILSGLPTLKICVAYRVDGRLVDEWPLSAAQLERAVPVYETYPRLGARTSARADPWTSCPPRRSTISMRSNGARACRSRSSASAPSERRRSRVTRAASSWPWWPAPGEWRRPVSGLRILVVGAGAREHALCWRLSSEEGVERVFVAPGNPLMIGRGRGARRPLHWPITKPSPHWPLPSGSTWW